MGEENWLKKLEGTGEGAAFTVESYHRILHPEMPDFLFDYVCLPLLQRLQGVGLLCGTDWTPLFRNQFYYSRLDHSVGVALIIWHFTHDKRQTLAGLLHDVSSPTFSHVTDFRNGDALTQQSTEALNARMIDDCDELVSMLSAENLSVHEVDDYHRYSIADNEMPGLSADRLEYMYPSGAALNGVWTIADIERNYSQIMVMKNKAGRLELGFSNEEAALEYTRKFCQISMILQHNEDKVAMQLLADVLTRALECGFAKEDDFYTVSEQELIGRFDGFADECADERFTQLFHTFRRMRSIEHTDAPLADAFCVSLQVKKRYVNPLVRVASGAAKRISAVSTEADECIREFLSYEDTKFGCAVWQ